jgi:agmatine deiminase
MPVQTGPNKFIRFTYAPDYLKSKRWIKTITDTDKVCDAIGICPAKSDIVLDGGNVIRGEGLVIMTDKIFAENPAYGRADLILQLESLLDARLIIIHWEPGDFTGHADGQVRHYDDNTVLINDYPKFYQPEFQSSLISALKEAGLTTYPRGLQYIRQSRRFCPWHLPQLLPNERPDYRTSIWLIGGGDCF